MRVHGMLGKETNLNPTSSLPKLYVDFLPSYKVRIDSPLISTSRKNISVRFKLLRKYFPPDLKPIPWLFFQDSFSSLEVFQLTGIRLLGHASKIHMPPNLIPLIFT